MAKNRFDDRDVVDGDATVAVRRKGLVGGVIATAIALCFAAACGSGEGGAAEGAGGTAGGDSDGLDISSGSDVHRYGGLDEEGNCRGLDVGDGCAGEIYEGEAVPTDLYLMFDQSGSMSTIVDEDTGTTRLDIVQQAVRAFLQDEESIGVGAGIGYFGHQPLKETTCSPADYAEPSVELGVLPGQQEALLASLEAREPTGETPTGAAIRGACEYVESYRNENPGRAPVILLVTDGEPKAPLSKETCDPTLDDAVAAAAECFEEHDIRTYVLGVGPSLTNLRVIAEAGGTENAFLADLDNAEQVLANFRAVRQAAQLPCELTLQEASTREVNFDSSTVAYLDQECTYVSIPEVAAEADCDSEDGGWYFDDAGAPTRIHLCEATCGSVKSTGQQLFYSIGCPLAVVR